MCPADIKGQRVEKIPWEALFKPSKTYHIPSSRQPNRKVDMHAFPQSSLTALRQSWQLYPTDQCLSSAASALHLEGALSQVSPHSQYPRLSRFKAEDSYEYALTKNLNQWFQYKTEGHLFLPPNLSLSGHPPLILQNQIQAPQECSSFHTTLRLTISPEPFSGFVSLPSHRLTLDTWNNVLLHISQH